MRRSRQLGWNTGEPQDVEQIRPIQQTNYKKKRKDSDQIAHVPNELHNAMGAQYLGTTLQNSSIVREAPSTGQSKVLNSNGKRNSFRPPPINTTLPKQALRKPALISVPEPEIVTAAEAGFSRRDYSRSTLGQLDSAFESFLESSIQCLREGKQLLCDHFKILALVLVVALCLAIISVSISGNGQVFRNPEGILPTSSTEKISTNDDANDSSTSYLWKILAAATGMALVLFATRLCYRRKGSGAGMVLKVDADTSLERVLSEAREGNQGSVFNTPTPSQREWAVRAISSSPTKVNAQ